MTTWGANADQLDGMAAAMGQAADLIDANRVRLNAQVHHAPWRGQHADQFRREWDAVYVRSLIAATIFLRESRTQLLQNANAQRAASQSDGGVLTSFSTGLSRGQTPWNPAGSLRTIDDAYGYAGVFTGGAAQYADAASVGGILAVGGFALGLATDLASGRSLEYSAVDSGVNAAAGFAEGAAAALVFSGAAALPPVIVGAAMAVGADLLFHAVFHESPGEAVCHLFHL